MTGVIAPLSPGAAPLSTALPRLKVLHVVRQYAPSVGGLETYVAELARRQSARHDVSILTLDRVFGVAPRLPRQEVVEGLPVVRIPFVGRRKLFVPALDPRLLRRFDILHVHATDQIVDLLAVLSWLGLPPVVLTTHGLFFHTPDLARVKRAYLRWISRFTLRQIRTIFAVSANDRSILASVGVPSILLRNPVLPLADGVARGESLLYVGRVSSNKRIDLLVEFVKALREHGRPLDLHVVGSDTEGLWPGIEERVRRYDLQGLVHRHGFLEPRELQALALGCGYAVSASRYEGYGLSIVEGMSIGLLPVVQDNAAFSETVGLAGCGLLTRFEDPQAAAAEFLSWAPRQGAGEREKAIAFARTQSWDTVADVVERSYRDALAA